MKDVPTPQLGSNRWLSNSDIKMLYKMYDCGKIFFGKTQGAGRPIDLSTKIPVNGRYIF